MISAHAVNAPARRRGRRADKDVVCRSCVVAPCRTNDELTKIQTASADVTADEVSVHSFEGRRREDSAFENAIAKSWGIPFNLAFKAGKHVKSGAVGHV